MRADHFKMKTLEVCYLPGKLFLFSCPFFNKSNRLHSLRSQTVIGAGFEIRFVRLLQGMKWSRL